MYMYGKCEDITSTIESFHSIKHKDSISWYYLISVLIKHGKFLDGITYFEKMKQSGIQPDESTYAIVLSACGDTKNLSLGQQIHSQVVKKYKTLPVKIQNSLINMYGKCNEIQKAISIFSELERNKQANEYSWTNILSVLIKNNMSSTAIEYFNRMEKGGIVPNETTYITILSACSDIKNLKFGEKIHLTISKKYSTTRMINSLINMYGKCNQIEKSLSLFKEIYDKNKTNIYSWNIILTALFNNKKNEEVINYFTKMKERGIAPDHITYSVVLSACTELKDIALGEKIYFSIPEKHRSILIQNNLMNLYGNCNNIDKLLSLFHMLIENKLTDTYTWNIVISSLNKNKKYEKGIFYFEKMNEIGIRPDDVTYSTVLSICANTKNIAMADQLFLKLEKNKSTNVMNNLMNVYIKSNHIDKALSIFQQLQYSKKFDVYSWSIIMTSFLENKQPLKVIEYFEILKLEEFEPNDVIYSTVIAACTDLQNISLAEKIYTELLLKDIQSASVHNNMINLYGKCNQLDKAISIFEKLRNNNKADIYTWNIILSSLAKNNDLKQVIEMYNQMKISNCKPDEITYITLISACADSANLELGEQIYFDIIRLNKPLGTQLQNNLIGMFGKCNHWKQSISLFNNLRNDKKTDIYSWTTIISTLAHNSQLVQAIEYFKLMEKEGFQPNEVTYSVILSVCADLTNLSFGQKIHNDIIEKKILINPSLHCSLINFYGKCGRLTDALTIFNNGKHNNNVDSYSAMINIFGIFGEGKKSLELLKEMEDKGILPSKITLISVLNACSHSGLINEAMEIFQLLNEKYKINPGPEHFASIVDCLSRAGKLDKAEEIINQMTNPSSSALTALLSGCRLHKDVERAERIFQKLIQLEPNNTSIYITLNNIYGAVGKKQEQAQMMDLVKDKRLKKIPGISTIVIDGVPHSFVADDNQHPEIKEVLNAIDNQQMQLVKNGYIPDIQWVTRDMEDVDKEKSLCLHR